MKKLVVFLIAILVINFSSNICHSQPGWFVQNSGLTNHLRSVYFINGKTGWAGGFVNACLKTTNGGANWTSIDWYPVESIMSLYFRNSQTGWAAGGTESNRHGLITFTTNGGLNWSTQYFNPNSGLVYKIFFLNKNRGWGSCGLGNILRTDDGGQSWSLIYTGYNINLTYCYFLNRNTGWTGGNKGTILKTTNGGFNWTAQSSGTNQNLQDVYFINDRTGFISGYGGTFLKTTNAGQNWIQKPTGTSNWLNSMSFINNKTGWCSGGNYYGSEATILKTTNSGENWSPQISPVNKWLSEIQMINSKTGWCVGNNGTIIKTTTGGAILSEITNTNSEIPNQFKLEQNYPNPFNPSTLISFQLPAAGQVSLIVYDNLGREPETLINKNLAAGTYNVDWNASEYTSGVYFYKLTTDRFSDTKRMILVK